MILLIDNYDSFTYNLYQLIAALGHEVLVVRNNKISIDGIKRLAPSCVILSPGPGRPEDAGLCLEIIRHFSGKLPILGVCLGHQAIAVAFGGQVVRATHIMHGKTSAVSHANSALYQHMPQTFQAGRYHSLTVEKNTLPSVLSIDAETEDKHIMGIRHTTHPTFGVQFHPESILSEAGITLLKNFIATPTLTHLLNHQLSNNQAKTLLRTLKARGETADEIYEAASSMRAAMQPVALNIPLLDIVGTGGDGFNTINISTGSALLAASMGVNIAKHGNRAVSSKAGSADVLEALGINPDLSSSEISACIQSSGFGFFYAPNFHPTLKHFKTLRKNLGIPTLFNLIGPLLNPASANYMLLGVADPCHLNNMAEVLMRLGVKRACVFHTEGLDELCPVGPNQIIEINHTERTRYILEPRDYGIARCSINTLQGGDAQHNASILRACLQGAPGPIADTLILNAGIAHYIYGLSGSIQEGITRAKQAHAAGLGYHVLQQLKHQTHEVCHA
jgi:anthranilate synthase/phosphoribosyltransferase